MSKKNKGILVKKGDVVWVRYRKDPLWPALIQNVYPKKITYIFFPLPELEPGKRPAPFHCNPTNVYRVSVGEQTPSGSSQQLVKAVRSAKAYLAKQGRQEGSDAPLRPDSKPRNDDDEEDEEVVDDSPAVSKESRAEVEPNEEDASGSEEEEDEDEEVEDVENGMPVLKRGRFSPPSKKADSSSLKDAENGDEDGMKNEVALFLNGFSQTLEDNYLSILDELFKEKMVRTYSVPSRSDMRISLAGSKFLTNHKVDMLFQRIWDFINERVEQCRILPAIHLASTVLFPEIIIRALVIYKGWEYEEAKDLVYCPEDGPEYSVDTDRWVFKKIQRTIAIVRVGKGGEKKKEELLEEKKNESVMAENDKPTEELKVETEENQPKVMATPRRCRHGVEIFFEREEQQGPVVCRLPREPAAQRLRSLHLNNRRIRCFRERPQAVATRIAKKCVELDLVAGRLPISIAAAAIYTASQAWTTKRSGKGYKMQQYSDDEISSEEDEEDLGVEEDDQVQAAELPPKEVDPRILEEYINKPDVLRLAKIHKSRFQHFDIQQAFQRMYKGKLIDMTVGCQNALAKQMLWDWANQIDKRTFPEDVKNKWLFDEVLRRVTQVEDGPCRKNLALRMKLDQLAKDRELIDIVGLAWDNYEPKNRQLLVEDISHGLSSCPIPVYCDLPGESGDVFKEPPEFDYIQKNVLNLNPEYKRSGITYSCNCIDGCKKDTCACIELNKEMNMYEGPILKDGRVCIRKPTTDVYSYALFCCGPLCGCPPSCPNRIEEILKRSRVEVYRSDTTVGFRARTLTSLAFGELVAEFTGEVKASNVNMDYSLELGSYRDRSIIDRLKIAFESDTLDERHWAGALPQHQIFIDPFKKGNEARFFSHGCFPNLQVLRVVTNYISTEMHRLVFFASRPIVAGTELCFNYGTSYVKRAQFDCQCRTLLCRSNDGCWYNFKSGLKLMDIQMIVKQIIQRWKVQVSIYDDLLEKIYDEAKRRGLEGFVDAPCNVPNCFNVKEELRNQPGIDEALSKWPRLKKKR